MLTRFFRNPAISNLFSCPVGLWNSGVQLYSICQNPLCITQKRGYTFVFLGFFFYRVPVSNLIAWEFINKLRKSLPCVTPHWCFALSLSWAGEAGKSTLQSMTLHDCRHVLYCSYCIDCTHSHRVIPLELHYYWWVTARIELNRCFAFCGFSIRNFRFQVRLSPNLRKSSMVTKSERQKKTFYKSKIIPRKP